MLRDRLLSASILIAVILALLVLDYRWPLGGASGLWLMPLLLAFAFGTAIDVTRLIAAAGLAVDRVAAIGGAALVAGAAYIPIVWPLFGDPYPADCPVGRTGWIVLAAAVAIFWVLVRQMATYDSGRPGEALARTLSGVFVSCYVGIPMAILVVIRDLGEGSWGIAMLISVIAVAKSSDAGAYAVGKLCGRHRLIPRLSPGKTWEGAIGGIVVANLVSWGCLFGLIPWLADVNESPPLWGPPLFGTALAVAAMVGDLAESLIKRESGAKDSGRTLPGLGGVWDVTDSLIAAVIPAWLALAAGVAGA